MIDKIKKAKADTLMRVNNVIYAKISDSESSAWRSAFGITYANAFINMVLQAKSAEFLTNEPLKPLKKEKKHEKVAEEVEKPAEKVEKPREERKFIAEKYNVREEERNEYTD